MGNSVVIASILDALIRLRLCDGGSECLGGYAAILCFCLWCCGAALGCFIQATVLHYSYIVCSPTVLELLYAPKTTDEIP